jgi:sodium/hydrogen antiporter
MTLLLVFAATLLIAVLISDIAERSVVSTAVLFLAAGFLAGKGLFGPAPELSSSFLERLSEIALFSVLFTDGIRTGGIQSILKSWHLPGRALLIGMPLTIIGIALVAHYLISLPWLPSFLVASVLSPTDPVFVAAIFRFEGVPERIKRLLNIESGLNDGLALPAVLLLLAQLSGRGQHIPNIAFELLLGIIVGIAVPWLGIHLEESRFFKAVGLFKPLNAFALGLLVLAICYRTGANLFLGAFAAGVSVASFGSWVAESFERFGELIAELLKLAALMIFGAVIAPEILKNSSARDYLFILMATFVVRPVAIAVSLVGTELSWREILLTGWFGPKGFASVVYGLLILQAGMSHLAHLVGLAVTASIVVYSSTDILIGRWFEKHHLAESRQALDNK